MIKTIIIDDEKNARLALRQEIVTYCPNITIIAEAESVQDGICVLQTLDPDLVFLDIQLLDGVGFDILEQVDQQNFKVIFTTAFGDYALQAIKFSALDYLLKPIDGAELQEAVKKIQSSSQENFNQQIKNLLNKPSEKQRIALATSNGIHLYELNTIIRCSAEGNYTRIYFNNHKKMMVAKTLKDLEELLTPYNFERIHKSHIINIDHLQSYLNKDNGQVVLSDQSILPVAQRKKSALLQMLNNFNG